MKIAVCSDLHLEFDDIDLQNTEKADVLVLGGDIMVAYDLHALDDGSLILPSSRYDRANMFYKFMERCSERFKLVMYIAGNHEHYHGDYAETFTILRKSFAKLKNVLILDKESVTVDDVVFFGGTLWTDMNGEDPITLNAIRGFMNDFRIISNSNRMVSYRDYSDGDVMSNNFTMKQRAGVFTPEDSVEDHKAYLKSLKTLVELNPTKKIVVLGHHAPSKMSTHPRYKDEVLTNGAYSTDLMEFILNNRNIKLWTHGHTHETFDYMIGTCRVVCNPRGYHGYENRADQFELKFVEV